MHVYRLQKLRPYQNVLLKGRMEPRPDWVFPLALTVVFGAVLFAQQYVSVSTPQALWLSFVLIVMFTWIRFASEWRLDYARRLARRGLVVLEEDKTYEFLWPLIEGYGHIDEVRSAIGHFAGNMRCGQERFGPRWYLGRANGERFLWCSLAGRETESPLNRVLRQYDCWQSVHDHIANVVDSDRSAYIEELRERSDRHLAVIAEARAAVDAAQARLERAVNAKVPDDLTLSEQLAADADTSV